MSFSEAVPSIQNSTINDTISSPPKLFVTQDNGSCSKSLAASDHDAHLDPSSQECFNTGKDPPDDSNHQKLLIPSSNDQWQLLSDAGAPIQQINFQPSASTKNEPDSPEFTLEQETRPESKERQITSNIPGEHHHQETIIPSSRAQQQSKTRTAADQTNFGNQLASDQEQRPESVKYQSTSKIQDDPSDPEFPSEQEPRPESTEYQITSKVPSKTGDLDDPDLRPSTKTWQQILIGMIGFGTEVCYATETALLVPILLQLGLPNRFYSITWFVSPVLGLLLQPIIGSCSDRCSSPWGRRRPFVLALGIGVILGLSLFLNGEDIGLQLGDISTDHTIGIVITMIGQIIMDWAADSSDTPGRSYMLDVFNPDDLEKALSFRALLAGLGSGFGYIINGIDWEKNSLGKALGSQLRAVFLLNGTLSALTIILTLCSIKETPLNADKNNKHKYFGETVANQFTTIQNDDVYNVNQPHMYGTFTDQTQNTEGQRSHSIRERLLATSERSRKSSQSSCCDENSHSTSDQEDTDLEWDTTFDFHHFDMSYHGHIQFDTKDENIPPVKVTTTNRTQTLCRKSTVSLKTEERDSPASVLQLLYSIVKMPRELRRLCINHYLSWTAFITILMFFTDYVGQVVYNGDPKAPLNTTDRIQYKQGVHMGSWGLCIFAFSAAISAMLYVRLLQFLSHRTMYVWSQVLFAVGTGFQAIFSDNKYVTLALCSTFGFMFTAIQTTPFSILADFHKTEKYVKSCGDHHRGLGTDVACLTCMAFLAQITVSSVLGPLMNAIGSHLVIVLFASAVAFLSAIAASVFVIYEVQEEEDDSTAGGEEHSGSLEDEQQPLLKSY